MDRQHSANSLCIVVDKVMAEQLLNQCMPVPSWLAVRYPHTHLLTFMPPPTGTSVAVPSMIRNNSDDEDWLLEVAYPPLDFIDLYIESEEGELSHASSGDRLPFAQRYVSFRNLRRGDLL